MNNKLYVGNLPYQIEEGDLKGQFAEFGSVKSVKIITDHDTGRSKGFGFVEMETEEEAQTCIENLNDKDFKGRNIRVNIARERSDNRGARRRW